MDAKLKHLEFVQGVINRLATDSFRLKGWAVVLTAAFLALLSRAGRTEDACLALVPIVVFWGLDGYFLWQERLFRALWDHVRVLREAQIDFSMDTRAFRTAPRATWMRALLSRTLVGFYGGLAAAVVLVALVAPGGAGAE